MNEDAELYAELDRRYKDAGRPSLRKIGALAGCSHQTVFDVLHRRRPTTRGTLKKILNALGAEYDVTVPAHPKLVNREMIANELVRIRETQEEILRILENHVNDG